MEAIRAYQEAKRAFADPRDAERAVFERVTAQLRQASEFRSRDEAYHEAVLANRRLWAAVVTDVSSPSNRLSREMKENLLSLGLWVQRECAAAATGKKDLSALIAVNEAIIGGLRRQA